jgi:hypothetical protein
VRRGELFEFSVTLELGMAGATRDIGVEVWSYQVLDKARSRGVPLATGVVFRELRAGEARPQTFKARAPGDPGSWMVEVHPIGFKHDRVSHRGAQLRVE